MGYESSIGKALVLYKGANNNQWPWIDGPGDWSKIPVGDNREIDANRGPAVERSITSLMFLLVRDRQPAKLFVCPSDKNAQFDSNTRYPARPDDPASERHASDFSAANNVSYSWQAPVLERGKFVNGLDDNFPDAVTIGDKTPLYDNPQWRPDDVSQMSGDAVMRNMSQNHSKGKKANFLYVGMNVAQVDRPDGGRDKDNIYTASGDANSGSGSATSLDLRQHLSARDTFLIGPVKGK